MSAHRRETVLVTGAAGYIGTVTCDALLATGYDVCGVDNLSLGVHGIKHLLSHPAFDFHRGDVLDAEDMQGVLGDACPTAVMHLAAVVGDPASKMQPERTVRVNRDATIALYRAAAEAGAKHFVFASTCSNYGLSAADAALSEEAPLNPLSPYATSKVEAEEWLLRHAFADCPATILRFSTAHGLSPRMRFDLTINEFAKTICEGRPLDLYDADTWRPYCHIRDIARAIETVVSVARPSSRDCEVYNVGCNDENHTKRQIVERVEAVTGVRARVRDIGTGRDRRNYRVSFDKIRSDYSFVPRLGVTDTARHVAQGLALGLFPAEERVTYGNV
jgi:nucleoside-diphosphate-sugar epimerase